jgi:hypothetical protein
VRDRAAGEPEFRELASLLFPDGKTLSERIAIVDLAPLQSVLPSLRLYVELLHSRKLLLTARVAAFERENGRPPNADERKVLVAQLSQFGPRAAALARKDHSPGFADEALVVLSVILAVHTKRDVLLIADDQDLTEQFFKLTSLLQRDYFAHRIATELRDKPERFGPRIPIPEDAPIRQLAQHDDAAFVVDLPAAPNLATPGHTTRAIQVVRPRDGGEWVMWCGIEQMQSLLKVQSETCCNSDVFLPLNIYVDLPPLPGRTAPSAYVVRDIVHPANPLLSRIHQMRALHDIEAHDPRYVGSNLYQAAKGQISAGRPKEAAATFRRLERYSSKRQLPAAQVALARFGQAVALEQVEAQQAVAAYDSVIRHHGNSKDPALLERVLTCRLNKSRAFCEMGRHGQALAELDEVIGTVARSGAAELRRFVVLAEFNRIQAQMPNGPKATDDALAAFEQKFASSSEPLDQAVRILVLSYAVRRACDASPRSLEEVVRLLAGMSDVVRRLTRTRDKWVALNQIEIATLTLAERRHAKAAACAYGVTLSELLRLPADVPLSLRSDRTALFGRRVWPTLRRLRISSEDWALALRPPQGVSARAWELLLVIGLEPVRARQEQIAAYRGLEEQLGATSEVVASEARRRRLMLEGDDEDGLSRTPELATTEPTVFSEIPLTISKAVVAKALKDALDAGQMERANVLTALLRGEKRTGKPAT